MSETHHRPPEGRIILVRRHDADEVRGEDVGVETERTGHRSCEPGTEDGLADAGGAGDDQQRRSDERALLGAMRAPQHVANRWKQVGEGAPSSADLTRERHNAIMSWMTPQPQDDPPGTRFQAASAFTIIAAITLCPRAVGWYAKPSSGTWPAVHRSGAGAQPVWSPVAT